MELEQGDIVICTVDRIVGANVFVKIKDHDKEGSIVLSEIAPGRIRNLRNHVVPKKKIVCKVLNPHADPIHLSLRRVKEKEKKEALEQEKLEKSCESMIKSVLKEKTPEAIEKIKNKCELLEFIQDSKEDSKELEKIVGKKEAERIIEILKSQKEKTIVLRRNFKLSSSAQNGLELIKKILDSKGEKDIRYLGSGKYVLSVEEKEIKKADKKAEDLLSEIEEFAKENEMDFKALQN